MTAPAGMRRGDFLPTPAVPRLSAPVRYLIAPAATLLTAMVQFAVFPHPGIAPFVFFFAAVVLASWLGGRGPGFLAVGLSAAVANYAFVGPMGWSFAGPELTATLLFVISASLVALLCASFRDVAFRAERIAETLRLQAEIMELSHDAILVWRPGSGIEFWNRGAEELYGFAAAEARGRVPHDLLQARFPKPWAEIEAELRGRRVWEGELGHTAKDGRHMTVEARLQIVPSADVVERVLEVNRDVTERRRAEEALRASEENLREADRRKDEFLAVLSHELRNPLAPIRNSLYVLERATPGSEQARRAQAVIERQVDHITRLVSDLLEVSRITRGKILLQRECLDLREVVRHTIEDHRSVFVARGVELRSRLTDEPVWVNGDRVRLGQALGNLLHNAEKFSHDGGTVSVTLEPGPGAAVLAVRDTGIGIDAAMLGRIFEPFTQADRSLDRGGGGLGLGLALVKGLAELHGGTAEAVSEGRGRGAEFRLRLPICPAPADDSRPVRRPAAAGQLRILVIEDHADSAESLREVLEMRGHETVVATSGPGGLEQARTFAPDLVLCDIGLPGMDGYAVARSFRADERLRGTVLVALTGYALSEDQANAKEAGFDAHLAKPADPFVIEELFASVRRGGTT